mmetsp:Transcript_21486/g.25879  ORF Transcript_21486/g.25879 Transcript_21486/m.25879 type:complete len:157 (+) Transcript_21486:80-550(+)
MNDKFITDWLTTNKSDQLEWVPNKNPDAMEGMFHSFMFPGMTKTVREIRKRQIQQPDNATTSTQPDREEHRYREAHRDLKAAAQRDIEQSLNQNRDRWLLSKLHKSGLRPMVSERGFTSDEGWNARDEGELSWRVYQPNGHVVDPAQIQERSHYLP